MLWCNALLQIFVNMGKDIGHAITIAALGNLIFKGIVGAIVSCENIQNRKNKDALETTTNIAVDFWNFLILLMLMAFVFFPMKNSGLLQHQEERGNVVYIVRWRPVLSHLVTDNYGVLCLDNTCKTNNLTTLPRKRPCDVFAVLVPELLAGPLQPTMPITITGASVPPLLRSPPSVRKQPTEGTAAADKMANMGIVGSVAAPEADAGFPPASVDAAKAGVQGLGGIGEEEDDDDEEESLTPEEKEQADHVKTVQAVIAAAEGAGFTFSGTTRWLAAEAYVNNKKLFDDADVDITECIKQGFKVINSTRVNEKIAALKRAEEAAVTTYKGGLSQEAIGDEEEEEEEEVVYSDDEYDGLSKQTLDAKKEQIEIDLAVAEKKETVDPIRIAFRQFNKELITLKGSLEYDGKEKELTMIRDYYNERYFENEFVESLSVWQMQFMAAMWNAEIEKRVLPSTIKDLRKNLRKVKSALQDIKMEQMQKQEDKKSDIEDRADKMSF